jgi:hypothetical protein
MVNKRELEAKDNTGNKSLILIPGLSAEISDNEPV